MFNKISKFSGPLTKQQLLNNKINKSHFMIKESRFSAMLDFVLSQCMSRLIMCLHVNYKYKYDVSFFLTISFTDL